MFAITIPVMLQITITAPMTVASHPIISLVLCLIVLILDLKV